MKSVCSRIAIIAGVALFTSGVYAQEKAHAVLGAWGVDLAGMDKSARRDSFFRYVNGKWFDSAVIAPDRTRTGGFDDLSILSEKRELEIIDALEAKPYNQLRGEEKQLRDLYDAFMDTAAIEKNGLAPAQKALDAYASIRTLDDIARAMGDQSQLSGGLFGGGPSPNPKDSNSYVVSVSQSGLSMPNRDYYLRDDPELAAARTAFRTYLTTTLELTGAQNAAARAEKVFGLETEIAKLHWTAAEDRDQDKTYNPMTLAQLESFAPGFPWKTFFTAEGIKAEWAEGTAYVRGPGKHGVPRPCKTVCFDGCFGVARLADGPLSA